MVIQSSCLRVTIGEPIGSTVQDDWEVGALWSQYISQKENIVMSIDDRGTKTPRSNAWPNSIYGHMGILASKDQADAAKKDCHHVSVY